MKDVLFKVLVGVGSCYKRKACKAYVYPFDGVGYKRYYLEIDDSNFSFLLQKEVNKVIDFFIKENSARSVDGELSDGTKYRCMKY